MLVEIFSPSEGFASLAVPVVSGNPGWTATPGPPERHRFRNRFAPHTLSPVRSVLMKEGRVVQIAAKSAGLPLLVPQGSIGIRITTGTHRACALFDAATIRKDEAGRFTARDAVAESLGDCSDQTMRGEPCGIIDDPVEPMCGGACPAGEQCVAEVSGQVVPSCVCLPEAATPCLDSGYPTCGGSCSGAQQCQGVHVQSQEGPIDLTLCLCVDPANTCDDPPGTCFGAGVCPPGSVCNAQAVPQLSCACGAP
jgi:hypothetical protein